MPDATVTILSEPIGVISPRLYGHFAEHLGRCCYGGLWTGGDAALPEVDGFRADVVAALTELGVPLLRWPGGCYADHYHWRDGVGPNRGRTLGTSCGRRVPDDNSLGTHEFLRLCELVGAEPYIAANLATGTPQELCDWVEYVNSTVDSSLARERAANGHRDAWGVRLWGIGNESWDCGGRLDPATYARELRRYATVVRHVDPDLELVAVGLDGEWALGMPEERDWNERVLETLGGSAGLVDHLSIHAYWVHGGPATGFDEHDYYALLAEARSTGQVIERAARAIAAFPAARHIRIALDEWGVWHPEAREWGPDARLNAPGTFEQPNTVRDAIAAGLAFEEFHRHSAVLSMANIAQIVNVLQSVLVTEGPALVRTPTYFAFELHRPHRGGEGLGVEVAAGLCLPDGHPAVTAVASQGPAGVAVTVTNQHFSAAADVSLIAEGRDQADGRVLVADSAEAVNTPDRPDRVRLEPLEISRGAGRFGFTIPPHSMATVQLRSPGAGGSQ